MFRGREIALSNMGMELLSKISAQIQEVAVVEQTAKFDNRTLFIVLAPK
jgi:translation initiation factor IF-3